LLLVHLSCLFFRLLLCTVKVPSIKTLNPRFAWQPTESATPPRVSLYADRSRQKDFFCLRWLNTTVTISLPSFVELIFISPIIHLNKKLAGLCQKPRRQPHFVSRLPFNCCRLGPGPLVDAEASVWIGGRTPKCPEDVLLSLCHYYDGD